MISRHPHGVEILADNFSLPENFRNFGLQGGGKSGSFPRRRGSGKVFRRIGGGGKHDVGV